MKNFKVGDRVKRRAWDTWCVVTQVFPDYVILKDDSGFSGAYYFTADDGEWVTHSTDAWMNEYVDVLKQWTVAQSEFNTAVAALTDARLARDAATEKLQAMDATLAEAHQRLLDSLK